MNVDKYYELRMASVFKGLNVKIDAVSVWIGGYIMRIQAANTFYTGTYSVLNTKSSFPKLKVTEIQETKGVYFSLHM